MQSIPPQQPIKIPSDEQPHLLRLLRPLTQDSLLRRVIKVNATEIIVLPDAAPVLLKALQDRSEVRWRQRQIATIVLRYMPISPEHMLPVAKVLGEIMNGQDINTLERMTKRGLWAAVRFLVYVVFLIPTVFVAFIFPPLFFGVLFAPLVPFLSPLYDRSRSRKLRFEAVQTLASLQLPESIGPLAKAARNDTETGRKAWATLWELLPELSADYYGQLPSNTIPELCSLLHYMRWRVHVTHSGVEMQRLLLVTLGKIGDGRAVPVVERYISDAPSAEHRAEAEAILPILTARREQEENSSILLRGSAAPPSQSAELLRPASGTIQTDPQQLLRATVGPNNDTAEYNKLS